MSEQDDNELDKAFRSGINKMRLVPPPVVWDGVRAIALQQQLFRYQTMNGWLKILSGFLGVALAGSIYFLGNKERPTAETKTVFVTKTDTVYVTKTEKVFVPIYQKNENVASDENLANNSSQVPTSQSGVVGELQNETISNKNNEIPNNAYEEKSPIKTTENGQIIVAQNKELSNLTAKNERKNPTKKSQKTADDFDTGVNAMVATEEQVSQKTSELPTVDMNRNSAILSKIEEKTEQNVEKTTQLAINSLNNLFTKDVKEYAFNGKLPEIFVRTTPFRTPSRLLRGSSFDWSRWSLSGYYSADASTLSVKTQVVNGQGLSAQLLQEQNLKNAYSYGLQVGYKLAPKWTLLAGFEGSSADFKEGGDKPEFINPEFHRNAPAFPKATSLGTGYIPNDGSGDRLRLIAGDHKVEFMRVPVSIKYDFFETRKGIFGSSYHALKFYVVGGFYWNFSLQQQLPTEIINQNGKKQPMLLTDFQGVEKNAYGYNLGVGLEYNFLKNWHFYLEPTYRNSLTAIVKDEPIQTYISSYSIKGGLKFQFGK